MKAFEKELFSGKAEPSFFVALFLGLRQVLWPEFHPSWAVWFVRSLQCSSSY